MSSTQSGIMVSKPAKVIESVIDSRTKRIAIRSGAKGTGSELWSCQYWPDSSRSVEQMEQYLADEVRRLEANGWDISY